MKRSLPSRRQTSRRGRQNKSPIELFRGISILPGNFDETRASCVRRVGSLWSLQSRVCDQPVGLDGYLDVGSFFELNLVPFRVGQTVWNPNLSIKVICTLDRDLGFLRFAGSRMR